jgi:hypothetical protein
MSEIIGLVRAAARIRLLFLPHAVRQMARPDRMITVEDVRACILFGQVIEDYPEDVRGHSCLLLGTGDPERPIHVVCAPKDGYLSIITAYQPDAKEWETDWRTRRR